MNEAWKHSGRRYKTDAYKKFERAFTLMLPRKIDLPEPPFEIYLKWGFSNSASDFDNPIKTTIDVISKKYKFNDKLIKKGTIDTEMVEKGKEYIEFKLKHLER